MEFFSERCADWLDNNPKIHPKKLAMEIERFSKMLTEAEAADAESDQVDDLNLTIQLLSERLAQLDPSLLPEQQTQPTTQDAAPAQATPEPANEAVSWDLTPLNPVDVEPEILDEQTRQQRKADILNIPGVNLGSSLKNQS